MRMYRVPIIAVAALIAIAGTARPAAAQAVYMYSGHQFGLYSCGPNADNTATLTCPSGPLAYAHSSYVLGPPSHVTATLTLGNPLPANAPMQDVTGLPGFHLTMSDTRQTLTNADAVGLVAEVSTDSTGQIDKWRVIINTGGANNGGIATINNDQGAKDSGTLACCDPTVPGNFGLALDSPGFWSTSNVRCTVDLNQSSYSNGQAVTYLLGVKNVGTAPAAIELKFWLEVPGLAPIRILNAGADGSAVLPAPFDLTIGPVALFTVAPTVPRGTYAAGCRLLDPVTGKTKSEIIRSFVVQDPS
jgi:hypothetical protein